MAFKYQALNESRSSLTSLSSLGSSRSIDSGNRQRPRLEFSAAGTTNRASNSTIMSEEERSVPCSLSIAVGGEDVLNSESEWKRSRYRQRDCVDGDNECVTDRQVVSLSERSMSASAQPGEVQVFEDGSNYTDCHMNSASSKGLHHDDKSGLQEVGTTKALKAVRHSDIESETGLYIHSSVRSGATGIRFSRQGSVERQSSGAGGPIREHGKLFKVLQRFSNKRAQQRVEIEAEKKARKSPRHDVTTESGREKENIGHHRRSHKSKHGKKGHGVPTSKSNDLLSNFSDVVYRESSELDNSTSASTEGLLLIGAADEASSGCGVSHVEHNHCDGQQCLNSHDDDSIHVSGASSKYQVSVRRSNSLNEQVYYNCSAEMVGRTTGTFRKSSLRNLSREVSDTK